jgi:hypothetical protein
VTPARTDEARAAAADAVSAPPRVEARAFLLPKGGATAEECEDAVAFDPAALRFAAADGATEAFDAGSWARRLASAWVAAEDPPLSSAGLRPWLAAEGARLRETWDGRSLPWYAEEKARAGSFAAFVGFCFEERGGGLAWRAVALGDTCLFQLRGGELRAALPLARPEDFNSAPALVPSRDSLMDAALARAVTASGRAEAGDVFLLLTDAAAMWFLSARGRDPALAAEFDKLLAAGDDEPLARMILRERVASAMKDDDVAALRVAVTRQSFAGVT